METENDSINGTTRELLAERHSTLKARDRTVSSFGSHRSHLRVLTRAQAAWSIHTCRR